MGTCHVPLRIAGVIVPQGLLHPANRHDRAATWSEVNPTDRWRSYTCDELAARDKASLDIFWLRDESLEDSTNLLDPDVLARETMEDLQAAMAQFAEVAGELE
ncbi:MAG: type I restriction endonuclease subunit M [Chloroflexi bacterium]|nr:type I restriction endonuclease subunit M [Chloroflexota bacterium]